MASQKLRTATGHGRLFSFCAGDPSAGRGASTTVQTIEPVDAVLANAHVHRNLRPSSARARSKCRWLLINLWAPGLQPNRGKACNRRCYRKSSPRTRNRPCEPICDKSAPWARCLSLHGGSRDLPPRRCHARTSPARKTIQTWVGEPDHPVFQRCRSPKLTRCTQGIGQPARTVVPRR